VWDPGVEAVLEDKENLWAQPSTAPRRRVSRAVLVAAIVLVVVALCVGLFVLANLLASNAANQPVDLANPH
jgi:hypothetical protein